MHSPPSFSSLRLVLFTALGFGLAGCDSGVDTAAICEAGSASGTSGSGGALPGASCEGAEAILATDGAYSGFARCPDGTIHRVEAVACGTSICAPACTGDETNLQCETDADCTMGPHGKCGSFHSVDTLGTYCGCVYTCANDAECGPGKVCVCAGVIETGERGSVCASAICATGSDCPSGECGLTAFYDGCGYQVDLLCRAESNDCRVDTDCPNSYEKCSTIGDGAWQCLAQSCAIGRPLLVDGEARTAPSQPRGDWARAGSMPEMRALDPSLRAALAAHWLEVAALEHASVASFARFTLQLLALGAPPDLLADAQQAAADEVEHARTAYALASAYAGRPVGPAALDVASLPIASELSEVLRGWVEEACIGETLGVAEAVTLAEVVADPVLRDVHARLAAEELRHAALAWRALQWGLTEADAGARRVIAEVIERAAAAAARAPEPREHVAREHGLLSADEIGAVRRRALHEVVLPCARALLGPVLQRAAAN